MVFFQQPKSARKFKFKKKKLLYKSYCTKATVSQHKKKKSNDAWQFCYFYGADMELKAHNLLHFLFWDPNLSGVLLSHTLSFYKLEVFSLLGQLPGTFASYFAPFYFHIHALSHFEHTALLLHKFFIPCACACARQRGRLCTGKWRSVF